MALRSALRMQQQAADGSSGPRPPAATVARMSVDRALNEWRSSLTGAHKRLGLHLESAWRSVLGKDPLGRALYDLGSLLVGTYAWLQLDLDILWQSPLPEGPKVFAANHPSTTDPFLMVALLPEPVSILIHDTLFRVPLFGRYLRRTGHVRVVPGNGQAAYEEALQLLRDGRSVVVFPEGGISPLEGGFGQPHSGVARLALRSGAPVVPLGIHLPRERIRLVETRVDGRPDVARWYLHGPYAVTGGEALYFRGDVEDRAYVRQVAQHVMHEIACLAGQSAQRLSRLPEEASGGGLPPPPPPRNLRSLLAGAPPRHPAGGLAAPPSPRTGPFSGAGQRRRQEGPLVPGRRGAHIAAPR